MIHEVCHLAQLFHQLIDIPASINLRSRCCRAKDSTSAGAGLRTAAQVNVLIADVCIDLHHHGVLHGDAACCDNTLNRAACLLIGINDPLVSKHNGLHQRTVDLLRLGANSQTNYRSCQLIIHQRTAYSIEPVESHQTALARLELLSTGLQIIVDIHTFSFCRFLVRSGNTVIHIPGQTVTYAVLSALIAEQSGNICIGSRAVDSGNTGTFLRVEHTVGGGSDGAHHISDPGRTTADHCRMGVKGRCAHRRTGQKSQLLRHLGKQISCTAAERNDGTYQLVRNVFCLGINCLKIFLGGVSGIFPVKAVAACQ